jgi:glycosyltransferase involved in cell wall biosynthesis
MRPKARAVLVGGDDVSYGARPSEGQSWKKKILDEVAHRLDMSRVHFVGAIPYQTFLQLLRVSAVHVYLTYPFVLSWSLLEAMATECLIVGSNTPPVAEVIQHEKNGLLFDFFSVDELVATTIRALENGAAYHALRKEARRTILARYDLRTICLPAHLKLIDQDAAGSLPPLIRT